MKNFIEEKSQKSVIFTIYMTLSKLLFDLKSPDVQNNMIGKARTEIACTLSWFGNWSEDQRNEFGKVLQKNENQSKENNDASIEALMSTMTQISLGTASKEGPSIFECQLKIFSNKTFLSIISTLKASSFSTPPQSQEQEISNVGRW